MLPPRPVRRNAAQILYTDLFFAWTRRRIGYIYRLIETPVERPHAARHKRSDVSFRYPLTLHIQENKSSTVAEMGDRLATIDMGQKLGACPRLFWERNWAPSNTMSPGQRPTSVPSGILTHLAVWPQRTWAENGGGCAPLGELDLHLTQCGQGRGLPASFILVRPTV